SKPCGRPPWTLTPDIQKPSRWLQTFRTPTWAVHHRLHHRQVADDVPLAGLDLLAGVEAANSAAFGGLHRLPVDDA
ncbi:MAG: hypothetical protein EOS41_28915, partial [Mesorhizobium sp.]